MSIIPVICYNYLRSQSERRKRDDEEVALRKRREEQSRYENSDVKVTVEDLRTAFSSQILLEKQFRDTLEQEPKKD